MTGTCNMSPSFQAATLVFYSKIFKMIHMTCTMQKIKDGIAWSIVHRLSWQSHVRRPHQVLTCGLSAVIPVKLSCVHVLLQDPYDGVRLLLYVVVKESLIHLLVGPDCNLRNKTQKSDSVHCQETTLFWWWATNCISSNSFNHTFKDAPCLSALLHCLKLEMNSELISWTFGSTVKHLEHCTGAIPDSAIIIIIIVVVFVVIITCLHQLKEMFCLLPSCRLHNQRNPCLGVYEIFASWLWLSVKCPAREGGGGGVSTLSIMCH